MTTNLLTAIQSEISLHPNIAGIIGLLILMIIFLVISKTLMGKKKKSAAVTTLKPNTENQVEKDVIPEPKIENQVEKDVIPEPKIENQVKKDVIPEPKIENQVKKDVIPEPKIENQVKKDVIPEQKIEKNVTSKIDLESRENLGPFKSYGFMTHNRSNINYLFDEIKRIDTKVRINLEKLKEKYGTGYGRF